MTYMVQAEPVPRPADGLPTGHWIDYFDAGDNLPRAVSMAVSAAEATNHAGRRIRIISVQEEIRA